MSDPQNDLGTHVIQALQSKSVISQFKDVPSGAQSKNVSQMEKGCGEDMHSPLLLETRITK